MKSMWTSSLVVDAVDPQIRISILSVVVEGSTRQKYGGVLNRQQLLVAGHPSPSHRGSLDTAVPLGGWVDIPLSQK